METHITQGKLIHLGPLADLHAKAFPGSLATALGTTYTRKMLSWFLSGNHVFLLVAMQNDRPVGYCGGLIDNGALKAGSATSMLQHSQKEAIRAFLTRPWLVFHPEMRSRYRWIWRYFTKKTLKSPTASASSPINRVGLVSIAVHPDYQNRRVGALLMKAFEEKAKSLQAQEVYLTVHPENVKAIRVYARNGWIKGAATHKSLTMTKPISLP